MCFCFVLFNLTCAEIYKPKSYIGRLWHERVKKKNLCPNDFSDQEIFMDQSHAYIALSGLEFTETLLGLIDPLSFYLALDHLFTPKSIPAKGIRKDIRMVTF